MLSTTHSSILPNSSEQLRLSSDAFAGGYHPRSTIMIVDDEISVATLLGEIFENSGYRVITKTSGEGALESFKDEHEKIDMVISNTGLPTVDSWEMLNKMRTLNDRFITILLSSYTDTGLMKHAVSDGIAGVYQKPFDPFELVDRVGMLLKPSIS